VNILRHRARAVGVFLIVASVTHGQSPADPSPAAQEPDSSAEPPVDAAHRDLSAYEAVHHGNILLKSGDAEGALKLYDLAESEAPNAREIAFARGLSRYKLGEFAAARDAFQGAALGADDALADDAIYSEGTTYHAEALRAKDDPKHALSKLETAMERYQAVLAKQPDHAAARDANFKAASVWRQIKQQLQQQQQQGDPSKPDESGEQNDRQENQENSSDDEQQDRQQEQDSSQSSESQESGEQNPQSSGQEKPSETEQDQPSHSDEQQSSESEQEKSPESEQEKLSQDAKPSDQQQDQEAAAQQEQREASQEQAERKLREMVQAARQRSKNRRQRAERARVQPVDKDW